MIRIGFNNFKAFGEKLQTFDRKPITLVYGANSVGKSALLHRELYMQYLLDKKKANVNKTTMFGDEIDFGGFDRFVHGRNPKNEIRLHISTDGFKNLHSDFVWRHFYDYTPEMQRSLLEKIEALDEQECKRRILNLPAIENKSIEGSLNLKLLKGMQFKSYLDVGTKIFDPESVWGNDLGLHESCMEYSGLDSKIHYNDFMHLSLSTPVFNTYYTKEASLLLDKDITLEDCKSQEFNEKLYDELENLPLPIIAKNNNNEEKALLAQKFLDEQIKPEWMCLTKFPFIPLLSEEDEQENIYKELIENDSKLEELIIKKLTGDSINNIETSRNIDIAFKNLEESIYSILFVDGYNNRVCDVMYCCIEEANRSGHLENNKHWNNIDFKEREELFSKLVSTTYREYLSNYAKQTFKDLEERKNWALDIYIGKVDKGSEVGITRMDISKNHQKLFAAVYLEDGKIKYELNQEILATKEIYNYYLKNLSFDKVDFDYDEDNNFSSYDKFLEALSIKITAKVSNKFWLNELKEKMESNKLYGIFNAEINKLLAEIQKKTRYIGPLRNYPSREDAFVVNDEPNKNNILSQLINNPHLRNKLNSWFNKLNLPYKVIERKLIDINELDENEEHFSHISKLKDKQEMKEYMLENFEGLSEITFVDTRTNTPVHNRDMGLGVTQILPIIVETNTYKDAQIVIEQPELHLHPALQGDLADEFIRSYKENGNSFLIESHSEHMLLRIMRRMRHTAEGKEDRDKTLDLTLDDVCLLYVDSDGESTYTQELRLSSTGRLLDHWPNGFFEDGFKERFT